MKIYHPITKIYVYGTSNTENSSLTTYRWYRDISRKPRKLQATQVTRSRPESTSFDSGVGRSRTGDSTQVDFMKSTWRGGVRSRSNTTPDTISIQAKIRVLEIVPDI
jgi:hypothetical protein